MIKSLDARQSPASPDAAAIAAALDIVIKRLEGILVDEAQLMTTSSEIELQRCIDRKSECLLELTRWSRMPGAKAASALVRPALVSLRAGLGSSAKLQRLHIDAVHELTEAVSEAIRTSESDGTYSRGAGRRGGKV